MMTRLEAAAWLQSHDNYCILTHTRPDGDTVGSSAALCLGLRKMGKTAYILENTELSGKLLFLHEGLTKPGVEENDIVICVDTAAADMLLLAGRHLADKVQLRIDHHGNDRSFAPNELVEPEMAACAEIIYELLVELCVELDEKIGMALYAGVSTDTGCFRFANTDAHSFAVAAACMEAGAKIYGFNQNIFDTNSLEKLKVQSWIVENTRFFRDGKVALCALPKAVEANATADDMDNVSGFLRSVEGVEICGLIREMDGFSKLSVRAIPGYDAGAICAVFGGGGHKGAAGANMKMTLQEAEKAVEPVLLAARKDCL